MTDRDARRKIHTAWIDRDNKPCEMCGSLEKRIIHRKRPGYLGGKYIYTNCQVLCIDCHRRVHNHSKFNVGDTVQINGRCPAYILEQIRHNRKRKITFIYYDNEHQCCYYHLGNNHQGASDEIERYQFRSYQLAHPLKRNPGRPRTKRKYNRRNPLIKCTVNPSNQNLERERAPQILNHLTSSKTAQILTLGINNRERSTYESTQ